MDRSTKFLLTVIATMLTWIAVKDLPFISDAMATTGVMEVKVVGMEISRYRPIPVNVEGEIVCKR